MPTARDVANYFLSLVDEEAGDGLTNLKLQKLVYYAQGFHLALYDQPLFAEPIEAWQHGPVIPNLYRSFKQHGSEVIPRPETTDGHAGFSPEQIELMDEVYSVYGQFSASKLRRMTHEEPPWKSAAENGAYREISRDVMRGYFTTLVEK